MINNWPILTFYEINHWTYNNILLLTYNLRQEMNFDDNWPI